MDTTEVTPIKVREEIKKIAKVSEGTLARYDVVMKSDEDDIKDKMLNTLYKNDKFKFLYNFKT